MNIYHLLFRLFKNSIYLLIWESLNMGRSLLLLALTTIIICSCGQSRQTTPDNVPINLETEDTTKEENSQQTPSQQPETYIFSDSNYIVSSGKSLVIQNSFPKGGGSIEPGGIIGYYDEFGTHYGYLVFWTRIANETDAPVELTINFPAEPFSFSLVQETFFRLFLPPDTMALDKVSLYSYGIIGLKPFLDTHFHDPANLQRTIPPYEEHIFYTSMLMHKPDGPVRTEYILEEQNLFYSIRANSLGTVVIPCGQLVFTD